MDLHGHSVKKNVFAYGPEYPLQDVYFYRKRQIIMFVEYYQKFWLKPVNLSDFINADFKIHKKKNLQVEAIFLVCVI